MVGRLFFCATLASGRRGHTPFVQAGAETSDTGAEAVKPTLFVAGSYCNHCYPFVTNRTFNANGEVVTARKLVIVINQQQCLLHLATTYKHSNRQIFWIIYCLSDNLGTPLK